jgi:Protein of unknown function (DUF3667)
MSPEQSAAVATAVAVAEPTSGTPQHETATAPQCDNCGASVAGKYCSNCGQRLEHKIHSVLHFTQEAAEDLTHADSRLWSTILALLFKPGFLTLEFLSGRRVRYLPPLRLYLVLSVLFFLVLGFSHQPRIVSIKSRDNGTSSVELVRPDEVEAFAAKPGETPQQRLDRICNPDYDGPAPSFFLPLLKQGCRKFIADGGHAASEAFVHNLPRALFILLPALALVMKAMYWRQRHYYVEHLLFFLHNHAFGFLVFALLILTTRFVPPAIGKWLTVIVWLYVPYYLFVSMRRVYGQGRLLTFAKLAVLSITYLICAILTLAVTGAYSVFAA